MIGWTESACKFIVDACNSHALLREENEKLKAEIKYLQGMNIKTLTENSNLVFSAHERMDELQNEAYKCAAAESENKRLREALEEIAQVERETFADEITEARCIAEEALKTPQ